LQPRGGEPQIRKLWPAETVQVVEGHFAPPIGKTDVLRPPKHLPPAVMKYTLREMTLVWEIYGGRDFPKHAPPAGYMPPFEPVVER